MNKTIPDFSKSPQLQKPQASSQVSGDSEQKMYEYQYHLKSNEQNLGYIGKMFGHGKEKSGNIAGICIIFSFVLIFCIVLIPNK